MRRSDEKREESAPAGSARLDFLFLLNQKKKNLRQDGMEQLVLYRLVTLTWNRQEIFLSCLLTQSTSNACFQFRSLAWIKSNNVFLEFFL